MNKGNIHPLNQFTRRSLKYFTDRGFEIALGPELETEWYNFDALNVPATHPSRDVQDTFWTTGGRVLRTHTTATDIREVKEKKLTPPFRLVVPGRCFRNEATDATHEHTFYQIDGIVIDKDINMSHLIGLLQGYMKDIFGDSVKTRVRPHLYPFVEPGMDLDIWIPNIKKRLNADRHIDSEGRPVPRSFSEGGWREMLGSGMAHPKVLENMGIDPGKWQGIMWGMGTTRYAMQYFGIDDVRLFMSGDLRFLKQF